MDKKWVAAAAGTPVAADAVAAAVAAAPGIADTADSVAIDYQHDAEEVLGRTGNKWVVGVSWSGWNGKVKGRKIRFNECCAGGMPI